MIWVSLWFDDNSTAHLRAAFHFAFVVWKVPLPKIKSLSFCMKCSITTAKNVPPKCITEVAASLRDLFLILLYMTSPFPHHTPLLLPNFFIKCSSLLQRALQSPRQLCRGKGCLVLTLRTSLSSLPPFRNRFYLGKNQTHRFYSLMFTQPETHIQRSTVNLICNFRSCKKGHFLSWFHVIFWMLLFFLSCK